MNDEKEKKFPKKEEGNGNVKQNPTPAPGSGGGGKDGDSAGSAVGGELLRAAAKVGFTLRQGSAVRADRSFDSRALTSYSQIGGVDAWTSELKEIRSPGFMVYHWMPSIGVSRDAASTVNLATTAAYKAVRIKNPSQAKLIEAVDLTLFDMCLSSCVDMWFEMVRLYGLNQTGKSNNDYYPRAIITALGYDPDDIDENAANMLYFINKWRITLNSYARIPAFKFHSTHNKLALKIFTDGMGDHIQTYMFKQTVYYGYQEVDKARGVTYVDGDFHSWDQLKRAFLDNILAIQNSFDAGLISGLIASTWGETSHINLPAIADTYVLTVEKDEQMLRALMNAMVVPVALDAGTPIARDSRSNGNVISELYADGETSTPMSPNWGVCLYPLRECTVLNAVEENPSEDDVINMFTFRLQLDDADDAYMQVGDTVDATTIEKTVRRIKQCGPVILTSATMYINRNGYSAVRQMDKYDVPTCLITKLPVVTSSTPEEGYTNLFGWELEHATTVAALLSCFDWHHAVYPIYIQGDAESDTGVQARVTCGGVLTDYQNPTVVGDDAVDRIFDAKILDMFSYDKDSSALLI